MTLTIKARAAAVCLASAVQVGVVRSQTPAQIEPARRPTSAAPVRTNIPYVEAKPLFETLREDLLPTDLATRTPAARASAWLGWISRRDAAIRQRLARGDEESVVNFLIFGTTFTNRPRVTEPGEANLVDVIEGRLDDLTTAIVSPGTNERLQFARKVVERHGIAPTTTAGKLQARAFLAGILTRVAGEVEGYNRAFASLQQVNDPRAWSLLASTFFRDRGLASDTSILSDFAIDQALDELKQQGILGPGDVRRVAIVGPGLDFTDKESGYDFYPLQTLQPFAVIDSLIRLGLAKSTDLQVTTFDLSPRINQHIEAARHRARAGEGYVLQLPRETGRGWTPALAAYWERFGDSIGESTAAVPVPADVGDVQLRAVRVRPSVVLSITPRDLNIVLQRATDQRWDLIVATNVLVYYEVFEQSLAMINVAKMLRPGGLFLSGDVRLELPATPMKMIGDTDVHPAFNKEDRVVWFRPR